MKKRILSLLLTAVLVCTLLPTVALATSEWLTVPGIEGGTIEFDSATGTILNSASEIITYQEYKTITSADIPATINGVAVTQIGDDAFKRAVKLTSVTIPEGVSGIGQYAFSNCTALTSVTIPASMIRIGWCAFVSNTALTDVYYGGTEAQWNAMDISMYNDALTNATIHFNTAPTGTTAAPTINPGLVMEEVEKTIREDWKTYTPTLDVTEQDVYDFMQSRIPADSGVSGKVLVFDDSGFDPNELSILSVRYRLDATGGYYTVIDLAVHIVPEGDGDNEKILADQKAIRAAVSGTTFSNIMDVEDVLSIAQAACKNGTVVKLVGDSGRKDATYTEKGWIRANVEITLGSERLTFLLPDAVIPMLVRAMPTALSITEEEWDVLRLTNNTRIEQGLYPLFAVSALQQAVHVRASELLTSYSHTRPDGSSFGTAVKAVDSSFTSLAENIAKGETTDKVVIGWMGSSGHRANILNEAYGYLGVGYAYNSAERCDYFVQIFAKASTIASVKTGSGSMTYADEIALEQDYLILTMDDGRTAYAPMDLTSMVKTATGYTFALDSKTSAVFTVINQSETVVPDAKTAFVDVPAGSYYEDAVAWAVEREITTGTTATTFSPQNTLTRAQVVTFLYRALETAPQGDTSGFDNPRFDSSLLVQPEPEVYTHNPFTDVGADAYYEQAVLWAVEQGITQGTTATTFSPNATCTHGQVLTFLQRALDPHIVLSGSVYEKYKSQYYGEAVTWAHNRLFIDALDSGFNPNAQVNRADAIYYIFEGFDGEYIPGSAGGDGIDPGNQYLG